MTPAEKVDAEIRLDLYSVRLAIDRGWDAWAARLTVLLVRKCRDRGLL